VRDALIQEWYNGREALIEDGVARASRLKDGLGRRSTRGRSMTSPAGWGWGDLISGRG
jgi:hypothetical protein